jgi:hypothetical protein
MRHLPATVRGPVPSAVVLSAEVALLDDSDEPPEDSGLGPDRAHRALFKPASIRDRKNLQAPSQSRQPRTYLPRGGHVPLPLVQRESFLERLSQLRLPTAL